MKKIKIIAGVVIFILLTFMLSINDEKMYVKKKHFNNSNEVLNELSNNQFLSGKNGEWHKGYSDSFNECFSKRKRLTDCDFYGLKMEIKKRYELNDKEKEKILKEYNKLLKSYVNVERKVTKMEPICLKARVYNTNCYSHDPEIKDEDKYNDEIITFVMIDEGEGMVIDYVDQQDLQDIKAGQRYD